MTWDKEKTELCLIGFIVLSLVLGVSLSARLGTVFREARNGTRLSHMGVIMTAVYQHAVEHGGVFPDCVPGPNQPAAKVSDCDDQLEPYIKDPLLWRDPHSTDYSYMIEHIFRDGAERIRIFSTAPEAAGVELTK